MAAQNLSFEGFSADMDPVQWKDYYRFYNHIELPERIGDKSYHRLFAGQSFLKYNFFESYLLGISIYPSFTVPFSNKTVPFKYSAKTEKGKQSKIKKINVLFFIIYI